MARIILIPYKIGSATTRELQKEIKKLGVRCLRVDPNSNTFRPKITDKLVYWGGSVTQWRTPKTLNLLRSYANNKLTAFQKLQEAGVSTVPWTTNHETALSWLDEGKLLVGRRTLTGHSGQGIEMYHQDDVQGDSAIGGAHECCPLFTQYIKKTFECRIHVFNGEVIDGQIKKKRHDVEQADTLIRNVHTGWVYCREDYTPDQQAKDIAIQATVALGLDFGAVDLIYNKYYGLYYVLEVNTAPGLQGTTLSSYINSILKA